MTSVKNPDMRSLSKPSADGTANVSDPDVHITVFTPGGPWLPAGTELITDSRGFLPDT